MYLAEQRHVVLSVLPSWNAGITPICLKTSRRLSSSQYSTNSRSSVRQISMERISIRFPVAAAPPPEGTIVRAAVGLIHRDFSTTQAPDVKFWPEEDRGQRDLSSYPSLLTAGLKLQSTSIG